MTTRRRRSRRRRPMPRPTASSVELDASTCASACPALAPTTVANLTAPILALSPPAGRCERCRRTLICSGLLPSELDDRSRAFAAAGLARGRAPPRRRLGGASAAREPERGRAGVWHIVAADAGDDHRLQRRPLHPHPGRRLGLRPDLRLRAVLLRRAAVPARRPRRCSPGCRRPTATWSTRA